MKHLGLSVVLVASLISSAEAADWPKLHGFVEFAGGLKISDDQTKRDSYNLLEQRLQLKSTYFFTGDHYLADKGGLFNFKGDLTVDEYYDGKTNFDLRELNLLFSPVGFADVKAGRQVLTWGTGDYLFVNDLFPKDYVSFFIGREDEYLKKPSDALKASFYPDGANVDLVWIPSFTPNTTAKGDRVSFFDSFQGGIAGTNSDRHLLEPPLQLSNSEYALRLYRNFGSNELALYYFRGFDKNPTGFKDELNRQLYYPRLDVYGASARGPFAGGIGNLEAGYYNSREDSDGTDRTRPNSMFKFLTGYSRDLGNDLSVGVQYLYEQRLNYGNYQDNLRPADFVFDEYRHLLTQRITQQLWRQTLTLSLFNFYSPSDNDGYVRPTVTYDVTDQWEVMLGANIPWGEDDTTEFGMMQKNKNVYVRARFNF